jgi:hypothetical protein
MVRTRSISDALLLAILAIYGITCGCNASWNCPAYVVG